MADSSKQATVAVGQLRAHLDGVGVDGVCGLLREAWPDLKGSDQEGMAPYKLTDDRIEQPAWEPPVLTFVIERHGGTAQGSSRADLQTWVVDLDAGTAKPATTGRRQLRPMSPRLDVRAIAADLTKAIASGASDPRLEWKNATTVRVRISTVIPDDGPKQTVAGRRKRLRAALEQQLAALGWERIGVWRYTQKGA